MFFAIACVACAASAQVAFPAGSGVIDVTAFGAVGDGMADDTAALNDALAAPRPASASAKIVYLPAGTYLISDTVAFPESRVVLQGEDEATTVIRLRDNRTDTGDGVDFTDPANARVALSMRTATGFSANQFISSIHDVTIDVGNQNAGAIGLKLHQNNTGGLRNVTVRSGDGAGPIGVELGGSDRGPGMVRSLTVEGFDTGIRVGGTEYSMVYEDLTLRDQNVVGINNTWDILTIRGLTSENSVPALRNNKATANDFRWGMVTIIDGVFTGGDAANVAIENEAALYLRNCSAAGYQALLRERGDIVPGMVASEFTSDREHSLFPSASTSLNLPILDTPALAYEPPALWADVTAFGAVANDGLDDSAGIQAAIDSGARTVFLPAGRYEIGSTLLLRGSVERIHGMWSNLDVIEPLASSNAAVFRADGATSEPLVVLEQFDINGGAVAIEHAGVGTLVGRNLATGSVRVNGTGPYFLEDAGSGPHYIGPGATAYFRQVNPENAGTKIINDGGTLVVLGLKTEKEGTAISTINGGTTELLGGLVYPVQSLPLEQPMFEVIDSSFSAIIGESSFSGTSNHNVVVEVTRGGELRRLFDSEIPTRVGNGFGAQLTLFTNAGPAPTTPAPAAYFAADETGGAVLSDSSGNGNDGAIESGAAFVPGLMGNALAFDGGLQQSVTLPQGLVGSAAGGVSVWFNSDFPHTDTGHIFYFESAGDGSANGGGSQDEAHLSFNAGGTVSFFVFGDSGESISLTDNVAYNDGAWHHALVSWDADGFTDLYLNGRRVDQERDTSYNVFDTSSGRVRLGRPNSASRFFTGLLDEIRVYDQPLTQDEAIRLFFEGRGVANYAPTVEAGPTNVVQNATYSEPLEGEVEDDGRPTGALGIAWTLESGPGSPVFADAADPVTSATYPQAGVYELRLSADDSFESVADTTIVNVFDPLPTPWLNDDVGSVGAEGWSVFSAPAQFAVNGAGANISGNGQSNGDRFHYVYQNLDITNNVEIVARVTQAPASDPDAKAGLMFRTSIDSRVAANGYVYITPGNGLWVSARSGTGGGTSFEQIDALATPPYWLKLVRTSTNAVRVYTSPDGADWVYAADRTVNAGGGTKFIGLAVTSRDNNQTSEAVFEDVEVRPFCPADVTTEGTSNGVQDGVVTLSDFSYYLSLWSAQSAAADVTTDATSNGVPDGVVTLSDFSFYLSLWSAGGCG
ncbi:MAG: glycosyl hydrolase family 28-related protein [Planctomycetota bacterium]